MNIRHQIADIHDKKSRRIKKLALAGRSAAQQAGRNITFVPAAEYR
jgi:hypothetical protein